MYLKGSDSYFEEVTLSDEKIKAELFSLKGSKLPGFDKTNSDIVKQNCYCKTLKDSKIMALMK